MNFARALLAVAWLAVTALPCAATNHALLIGVGSYAALGPELQLRAPANDVKLMRDRLLERGFDAAHIETLADSGEGARPPTRAAIVGALDALAERVRPGDWVYLHFAGHGSLQPADATELAGKPTRSQPIFLPSDVREWNGETGRAVPNALTDTTLRALLDRLNDRGADVFAVFDACHSARLVRGVTPVASATMTRLRNVDARLLGEVGVSGIAAPSAWEAPPKRAAFGERRGRAVYFYAAQSLELADSMPLADHGRPVWHGLFTWHLAQALAPGRPLTHRQLAQAVLARYDRLDAAAADPLFAGDGLDLLVFGQRTVNLRQWPLERAANDLAVAAGALDGLADGAVFAVLTDPAAPAPADPLQAPPGTLGFVRLAGLDVHRGRLEPVTWRQWPMRPAEALAGGTWVRLVTNPPAFGLRVVAAPSSCAHDCAAATALAKLRRDGVPGVEVRWGDAAEAGDVRLRPTPRGLEFALPQAPGDPRNWGEAAGAGDEHGDAMTLAARTADALQRIARLRNLLRLASRLAEAPRADLALEVLVATPAGTARRATPDRLVTAMPGEVIQISGRQTGGDPLDVALFWLGADQSVRQIYPEDARDAPRLATGAALSPLRLSIDSGTVGVERLLVVTLPMRRNREAADFRFLEQSPLDRLRGAADADLQALVDACFADHATRGEPPALPADLLGIAVYTFAVRP